jgi:F-box protein 11
MKKRKSKPAAFMSYVHSDDEYGPVTRFCERLSHEVGTCIGEDFLIFQDRKNILWGQNWKERIRESLDEVTFLIPIITPRFFGSSACRDELQRFLEREKKLGRNDLVLPVYFVDCPLLNDEGKRARDELAQAIADHQYADWRDLRFEPFTSPQVGKTLEKLAVQIRDALERVQASEKREAPEPDAGVTRRPVEDVSVSLPLDIESVIERGEPTRGPSAKTEPPIRMVDQMHRGDHVTITEAIETANPGDRILVRPGLYQEGLVIDKPGLEIIGDGNLDDIVVQAVGMDALLFKTTMGRVTNLTLRQMGGGDWYAVDIAQGRLELEECDIASQSLTCVGIHDGADPRLRRNRIHDSTQGGVLVYDNGQGVLEDNDIFGNAYSGVAISDGGNPTLRRNRIHDGQSGGVSVYDNGEGVLEDNDIFGNAYSGVAIRDGGNPILRRNRIHDDKQSGVFIYENGQGVLEDNDIFGNAYSGVAIRDGGNPILRRNRIHDSTQGGVLVYDNGQGVLEDNDIFGNAYSGVAISDGGNPTLRRNRIHDGQSGGVSVYDNGEGVLEDNDIFGNAHSGVAIGTGSNPTLRRNRVNKNGYWAVWVYDEGGGTIEDNDLRGNAKGAWNIASDSEPNLRRARNKE